MEHGGNEAPPGQSLLAALRTLVVDMVTADLSERLEEAEIVAIVLKGPSIAQWLYGEGERSYLDTDVLVAPNDLPGAERLLRSLGFRYVLEGASPDEEDPDARPWLRDRDDVCVDLHRRLRGAGLPDGEAWQILCRHTERMIVAGASVRVLTPPARALSIALHAAHNGLSSQQTLNDLERALDQVPMSIWSAAADLASQLLATRGLASGLRLLPAGTDVADSLRLPGSTSAAARLRSHQLRPLALGFASLHERAGWKAKFSYIRYNLVPTPAFIRFWSPLARRGRLGMMMAYVWRWIWLLWYGPVAYLAWRRARWEAERGEVS